MHSALYLNKINLINFKSYENASFVFDAGINFILGNNGIGKTNLLDALYTLAMTKSAFVSDAQLMHFGTDFFVINAEFRQDNAENTCLISLQKGKSKTLKWNDCEYEKISEHIGKIPLVLIKPDDTEVITGGSENRRKFFDNLICQADAQYLNHLLLCNFLLKERNALLKNAAENKKMPDFDLIATYDARILPLFEKIHTKRKKSTELFFERFLSFYQDISKGRETPELTYQSQLDAPEFNLRYEKNFTRDMFLERTELGIHKDDYLFNINGNSLKKTGSQGQIKTYLLALKLAACVFLREKLQKTPVLLLDDIADKLDKVRLKALSEIIMRDDFGQVFITDAHTDRIFEYFPLVRAKTILLEG